MMFHVPGVLIFLTFIFLVARKTPPGGPSGGRLAAITLLGLITALYEAWLVCRLVDMLYR